MVPGFTSRRILEFMSKKIEHLFSCDDGALYDTRVPKWQNLPPLRAVFRRTFSEINTTAELRATLRAGAFAWPGGYPLFFITSDGAALSFETVRKNLRAVTWSIKNNCSDGWKVVACAVNWEDGTLTDEHTGERIESAYAD